LCFDNCDCLLYSNVAKKSNFISAFVTRLGKLLRIIVVTGGIDGAATLAVYEI